jgi:hypothetical protein
MAKKKLTVTVDESILDDLNRLGFENVSATVNEALASMIERKLRLEALGRLADDLLAANGGPPTAAEMAAADAVLDELEFGPAAARPDAA